MRIQSHFALAVTLVSLACSGAQGLQAQPKSQASSPKQAVQPKLAENLGQALANAIAQAETIAVARIGGKPEGTEPSIQGRALIGKPMQLSPEQAQTLQKIMLDPQSHVFGARARCRFRPKVALLFHHAGQKTGALVAGPKCSKWSFELAGKTKILDLRKPTGDRIMALLDATLQGTKK